VPEQRHVLWVQMVEVPDVALRDDERVVFADWSDVPEAKHTLVFVQDRGW
jgi:hypothetical protein